MDPRHAQRSAADLEQELSRDALPTVPQERAVEDVHRTGAILGDLEAREEKLDGGSDLKRFNSQEDLLEPRDDAEPPDDTRDPGDEVTNPGDREDLKETTAARPEDGPDHNLTVISTEDVVEGPADAETQVSVELSSEADVREVDAELIDKPDGNSVMILENGDCRLHTSGNGTSLSVIHDDQGLVTTSFPSAPTFIGESRD